jgi:hypothetical protein
MDWSHSISIFKVRRSSRDFCYVPRRVSLSIGSQMRFFLDYKTKDQALYDYQGEEFMSPKDAFDFAQETARSLRNKLDADWTGWSVEVRDAHGKTHFSFAVDTGRAVAA